MSSEFESIYPDFLKDCSEIIGAYLAQYGFVESIRDDVDLFMEFRNTNWAIQVDFLSGFPHLGIGMGFACVDGRTTVPGLLDQALDCRNGRLSETLRNLRDARMKTESHAESLKIELQYSLEILEICYKPLLTGQFLYVDYEQFLNNRQ